MASKTKNIRIVCISDTHNAHSSISLPKGDILIHAGDLTNQGTYKELKKAIDWISQADFQVKIVVAGNHDLSLDPEYAIKHKQGQGFPPADEVDTAACRDLVFSNTDIVYLQHSGAVVQVDVGPVTGKSETVALRVFGSPYSPDRGKQTWAFQYGDNVAEAVWEAVPSAVDVLITHTPPKKYCDASRHWEEGGCSALAAALSRIRPWLHVCGHCHEGRGAVVACWDRDGSKATAWQDPGAGNNKKQSIFDVTGKTGDGLLRHGKETVIVNASITANSHGRVKLFNKPIVINLPLHQHSNGANVAKKDGVSAADA